MGFILVQNVYLSTKFQALPPRGWKIEPDQFELNIDGETDACSKNKDMNFEFIGFGVTGSVLSKGSDKGPGGIVIELLKSEDEVLAEAVTDADGKYVFFGVSPGAYSVRIGKKLLKYITESVLILKCLVGKSSVEKFAFDATKRKVNVGEDVGNCDPFNILGYSVEGRVVTSDSAPQEGVSLELFGLQDDGKTRKSGQAVAKAVSKASGEFRFPGVPVGHYEVVAVSSNLNMKQSSVLVNLGHDHIQTSDFVVESFSLTGKVANANGSPLKDVTITATFSNAGDKQTLKTGADGAYSIAKVSSSWGSLQLEASRDGYQFDAVNVDKLSPGTKLPAIKPSKYKVEGQVDRSGFDKEVMIKISKKDEVLAKETVDAKGSYSTYLPIGDYSLSVEVSASAAIGKKLTFSYVDDLRKIKDVCCRIRPSRA